jgi:opacity protein-like surface antigen
MKHLAIGTILLALSSACFAGGYAAADLVMSHVKPVATAGSGDVGALQFRIGTAMNTNGTLGGEFRAALGVGSDTDNGVRYEMNRYFGAYLRAQFPNSMALRPYGMLGFTRAETTINGSRERYNDISLGMGAEYSLTQDMFLAVEYLRAVDRSTAEISNISVGLGARF